MQLVRRDRSDPGTELGLVFGGVLALSAGLAAVWIRVGLPRPICQFREWTGVACPTCGSTRMVEALLGGDAIAALRSNPLVFLALTVLALWAFVSTVCHYWRVPGWRVALDSRDRWVLRLLALAVLAAGWVYQVVRGI